MSVALINRSKGDDPSFFHGITAIVRIVGRILSIQTKGTCQYLSIHDGTGTITARQWTFPSLPAPNPGRIGDYVKVIGSVKQAKDAISLSVQDIQPVHSFDSITLHWLEVIRTVQAYSHRDTIINLPGQQRRVAAPVVAVKDPSKPVSNPPLMEDPFWGDVSLTPTQQKVLQIIQQYGLATSEGISMSIILQNAERMGISNKDTV